MRGFDEIWEFLSNVLFDEKSGKGNGIDIDFKSFEFGDRYYNESGEFFIINLFNDTYELGYVYITEDNDDWAQSECYKNNWCTKNEKNINYTELYEKIKNFKELNREYLLNKILN